MMMTINSQINLSKRIVILIFVCFSFASSGYAQTREITYNELAYTLMPKMDKPIVIDFWAEWCGPCHKYTPVFKDVARLLKGKANFYRVNVDNNSEWCQQWGIESIPTTIVIPNKSGDIYRKEGLLTQEALIEFIQSVSAESNYDPDEFF